MSALLKPAKDYIRALINCSSEVQVTPSSQPSYNPTPFWKYTTSNRKGQLDVGHDDQAG